jgi:flagellar FliL protein
MAKDKGDKKVEGGEPEEKKKGKGKLIIIAVVVAALAAGAYVVGTKSAAPADSAATDASTTTTTIPLFDGCVEEPEPGAPEHVVDLPQMSINLTDGHYLRVSVSLGICADVVFPIDAESGKAEELRTAPALDIIVSTLSGMSMEVLSTSDGRAQAKDALKEQISAMYPAVVYEVFFLEFVMQ